MRMSAKTRTAIRRRPLGANQKDDDLVAAIEVSSHKVAWQISHPTAGLIDCGEAKFAAFAEEMVGVGWLDCGTGDVVTTPILIALGCDEALRQMQISKRFTMVNIKRLTGSVQQHMQVFLNETFERVLAALDPAKTFAEQLRTVFGRPFATIWKNSSTQAACDRFATFVPGGNAEIAELTGAIPTRRFFGPAIDHIINKERGHYDDTTHITLGCGLLTGLFLGKIGPLEQGDAAGGNLMNIRERTWERRLVDAIDGDLFDKLPEIVDANELLGNVSEYLVQRYGFSPDCQVLPCSGDNPAALLGRGVYSRTQRIRVNSKGTSETELGPLPADRFSDPSGAGAVFGMLTADENGGDQNFGINTYQNGTRSLERVMAKFNIKDFDEFRDILARTPPGNHGEFMIGFFEPEICPRVSQPTVRYFGGLDENDRDGVVRAIVEFQAINRLLHSDRLGEAPAAYLATGGGGMDEAVAQIDADVFNATVYLGSAANSVNNGDCIRGMHSLDPERYTWEFLTDGHCAYGKEITPKNHGAYVSLIDQLRPKLAELSEA